MKKITFKIFLCFNIYAIISSKCEDYKNNENGCLEEVDKGRYPISCCFYKKEDEKNGNGLCKTIPFSSYPQKESKEYIDGILYNVNCSTSSSQTYNLESCGNIYNKNPTKKDCRKYSTYVDSCCYYSGKNKDDDPIIEGKKFDKGCYWLGSKYEGSIFWAGARLECSFKFLKYSLFTLLCLIILF